MRETAHKRHDCFLLAPCCAAWHYRGVSQTADNMIARRGPLKLCDLSDIRHELVNAANMCFGAAELLAVEPTPERAEYAKKAEARMREVFSMVDAACSRQQQHDAHTVILVKRCRTTADEYETSVKATATNPDPTRNELTAFYRYSGKAEGLRLVAKWIEREDKS